MLEENLVQPGLLIQGAESGFQPLYRVIPPGMVQALVVNPANPQHRSQVAGFGQKCVLVPKAVKVDLRLQRPGLFPVSS